MPKPQQPHDGLFKWTFSRPEHAEGLLKAALPEDFTRLVEWSTLRVESGSYVDDALRHRHSDLLLSARMGERSVFFYALVEQQRDPEPLMIFRMAGYMMRHWEALLRDNPAARALPPIVPILIYNGVRGWTSATAFQDLVDVDEAARPSLAPYIPQFALRLIDLGEDWARDLREQALTALGKVALSFLSSAGDDERLIRDTRRVHEALHEVGHAPDHHAALGVLFRYLSDTHTRMSRDELFKVMGEGTGPEVIVTFIDQIEAESEQRGQAKLLLQQLALRFGPVPADVRARVMAAEEASVARWAALVLTAPTLAAVLGDLH